MILTMASKGFWHKCQHAQFKLLSANYDFSNTAMDGYVKPFEVYTLNGLKIGVYGIGIALEGLVTKKLYKETQYLDPFEIALDTESELKQKEQCDLVICLSHLGYHYKTKIGPMISNWHPAPAIPI